MNKIKVNFEKWKWLIKSSNDPGLITNSQKPLAASMGRLILAGLITGIHFPILSTKNLSDPRLTEVNLCNLRNFTSPSLSFLICKGDPAGLNGYGVL